MEYTYVNTPAELPEWLSIEKFAVFLNEVMRPYEDKVPDVERGLRYALSDRPGEGGFIVIAAEGERLVGAVVMLDTGMSGYVPGNLLLFIAVDPSHRNEGIGGELIGYVKQRVEGDIKLHVEPDNPAKRLYERQGFTNKYLEMRYSSS
jgi:[ribosomal protein S18]-alanine N-acetyltransferase